MAGLLNFMNAGNGVGGQGLDRRLTPLRTHFVQRLHRLIELKAMLRLDTDQRRLVNHALYSTYWDCVNVGARAEASTILGLPHQVTMTAGAPRRERGGGRDDSQDTGPA
jgi:hypothetical protein